MLHLSYGMNFPILSVLQMFYTALLYPQALILTLLSTCLIVFSIPSLNHTLLSVLSESFSHQPLFLFQSDLTAYSHCLSF